MTTDIVSTKKLEIVNSNGKCMMSFDCCDEDGMPYVRLFDKRGCERLTLSLDSVGQPQVGLLAEDGHTIVGIGVKKEIGSGFNVFDEDGNLKVIVGVDGNGKVFFGTPDQ